MDPKNAGSYEYGLIPSDDEPFKQHKAPIGDEEYAPTTVEGKRKKKRGKFFSKRTFCVCFSDIMVASNLLYANVNTKDEQRKDNFRVKDKTLLTNVEAEPDKSMRNKSCFLICCSTVEVANGTKQEG